jgi:hypothetical protein
LANCDGSPSAFGSSEIVSAYLVPTTGELWSLCVAEALLFFFFFFLQLFDKQAKSNKVDGTIFTKIFWDTAPTWHRSTIAASAIC